MKKNMSSFSMSIRQAKPEKKDGKSSGGGAGGRSKIAAFDEATGKEPEVKSEAIIGMDGSSILR